MSDKSKSAFPCELPFRVDSQGVHTDVRQYEDTARFEGMSLREWYAGMAMQGLIRETNIHMEAKLSYAALSRKAFAIADAMLAESETEKGA